MWKIIPDVNTLFNELADARYRRLSEGAPERDLALARPSPASDVDPPPDRGVAASRHQHEPAAARRRARPPRDRRSGRLEAHRRHRLSRASTSSRSPISFRNRGPRRRFRPTATIPPARARLLARAGWTPGPDGILSKGALAMHLSIYATTGHQENTESQVLIQSMLRSGRHRRRDPQLSRQLSLRDGRPALRRQVRSRVVDRDQRPRSRTTAATGTEPSFRHTAQTRRGSTIRSSTRPALSAASTFDTAQRKAALPARRTSAARRSFRRSSSAGERTTPR